MPGRAKFGSRAVRDRLAEALIVIVVLVAAVLAYWLFHH